MTYLRRKANRMLVLKKISKSIPQISYVPNEFDDDYDEIMESLEQLRAEVPLGISHTKDPTYILVEDGHVYGAAYVGNVGGTVSFDLIISPSHRGQGWSEKFVDLIVDDFKDSFMNEVAESLEVHVINPILVSLLKRKGFVVTEQHGSEFYMKYENENYADDEDGEESYINLKGQLNALKSHFARAAQSVYDKWEQNDDGQDEHYGYGGICHDIADEIIGVIYSNIDGASAMSIDTQIGTNHVFVVAWNTNNTDEAFEIDIDPFIYETGDAYTWKKIKDVTFSPSDISILGFSGDVNDIIEYYQ